VAFVKAHTLLPECTCHRQRSSSCGLPLLTVVPSAEVLDEALFQMPCLTSGNPCAQVGETYDWRLSIANMERRDGYFTRLKLRIEMLHGLNKEKVRSSGTMHLLAAGPAEDAGPQHDKLHGR
jgi:Lecithin:cholesterol acyltransferase